ncbi:MAG: GFA family protein [Verrucomicrobiota bacterium]|nr:GFA family protein [Verrucomicrobiota bacterium]
MNDTKAETHSGTCHCGAVQIEALGPPLDMGYCHCDQCRRYSGAPIAGFTLWKAEDVKVTKGGELLGRYKSSEISDRRFCTKCGSHVMIDHPTLGLTDVRDALPATVAFKPTVHLNYEETILPIKDGLPKLRDFPAAIGGSGEAMPE